MDRDDQARPVTEQADAQVRRPKVLLVGDVGWGLAWGFVLVCVGAALLLDHMGVFPFGQLYRFWPLLLILFGVMNISTQSSRGFGIVLVLAGILLLLNSLDYLHLSGRDFWPIVIIAIGVLLIWGSIESRSFLRHPKKIKIDWTKPGAAEQLRKGIEETYSDPNFVNAVAVFSGCERRVSGHFQGGKAVSVFGGVELDLRDAEMDDEAVLEINCIFGGVEIRVPDTWNVHSRSFPIFGGLEDKSRRVKVVDPTGATKPKTLTITGMIVFGGVEISN